MIQAPQLKANMYNPRPHSTKAHIFQVLNYSFTRQIILSQYITFNSKNNYLFDLDEPPWVLLSNRTKVLTRPKLLSTTTKTQHNKKTKIVIQYYTCLPLYGIHEFPSRRVVLARCFPFGKVTHKKTWPISQTIKISDLARINDNEFWLQQLNWYRDG